jgi:DNA-binding transcriptional MerR regulator
MYAKLASSRIHMPIANPDVRPNRRQNLFMVRKMKVRSTPRPPPTPEAAADESAPRYRSGAVARMIQMPVSTLRVWERRYGVVQPALSASGHRLYSALDVRRLAQLKQLTDTGHAIGSIAALDEEALRQVASTHASSLAARGATRAARAEPWRIVVVGEALARRLQRKALAQRVGRAIHIVATHVDLAQVGASQADSPIDALQHHAPRVGPDTLDQLEAAVAACGARRAALLYGFGATSACDAIAARGIAILREAQDDRALAVWLRALADGTPPGAPGLPAAPASLLDAGEPIAPRRYDDAALTDFAGLSSTIACECPRHVAELLMQLSHFEAYSADCEIRSPADASLHAYLRRVAGTARALFESALERVAIQEGLMLPP